MKTGILRARTNDFKGSPTDYAAFDGRVAKVGMGPKNAFGFGEVGLEMAGVKSVKVRVKKDGLFKPNDDNSMAGFIIDYQTSGGYTKRVAMCLDRAFTKRWGTNPSWGKNSKPDVFFTLKGNEQYEIDLGHRAPKDWDGQIWFTVLLQNSGQNTSLRVEILEP